MTKFCLLIICQTAVMFNKDVYNAVDFRRDFKEGKGISWVKLKWLFQVPEERQRRVGKEEKNSD